MWGVFMKKIIALFIIIAIFCFPLTVNAEKTVSMEYNATDLDVPLGENLQANAAVGDILEINAKSVILMEPYTKKILYESNADEKLAPASITKIMSLLLVMETIDSGKLTLETQIQASEHACSMGGSQIWLEPGETMTVDELLKATVIASANDATVALGEAIAGSEEGFVAMMNEKAKALGMNNTTFVNATGLDADEHLTTAHDVAIMSCELVKHDLIKNYSTVWMDTLRNGESELVNTNKLVRFYNGAIGLKTGTTSKAGSCLSAAAERNGLTLVGVVLGSPTSNDRFNGARKLLDYGFANYSYKEVGIETPLEPIKVKKGVEEQIELSCEEKLSVLLKRGEESKLSQRVELPQEITAPIQNGDTVGYLHISLDSEEIGVVPIKAASTCQKLTFFVAFCRIFKTLFSL